MKLNKRIFFQKLTLLFAIIGVTFAFFGIVLSILGFKELVQVSLWIWIICAPSIVLSMYFYNKFDTELDTPE
jgi:glucan phosphoethanolaminetransferase (alkaline phosphatase superfamily)